MSENNKRKSKEKQSLILIVDDITENLQILGNLLRENNYRTAIAKSGFEALDFVLKRIPDLILLDINMPVIDGYEVCARLKSDEKTKDIPVIFISALSDTEDILKGFVAGGVDFITKPFQREEVLARVKTHLTIKYLQEDLKKQNLALRESERKLIQANATKDKLFSIIAHDLRGPIGTIVSFLEILVDQTDSYTEEDMKTFLLEMKSSSETTYNLLDNLLNWALSQKGAIDYQPENLVINDIVNENIELLSANAKKKSIKLFSDISDTAIAFFDKNMITTVLRNLISNALKFTQMGGEVKISAFDKVNFIEIAVSDNGTGITEENLKKLFHTESNFTTIGTSSEKGTGLGLILCREFIEKHGGTIWVKTEVGKGSKFIFTLPKQRD